MTSSLFAIDLTDSALVWAQAQRTGKQVRLQQVGKINYANRDELTAAIQNELTPQIRPRDKVVVLAKGVPAYYRQLNFPFDNPRKIAATLPMEMASQLPVALDTLELAWGTAVSASDGAFQVPALAVSSEALEGVRDRWVYLGVEVHQIVASPFAMVTSIAAEHSPCFIIHVDNSGSSVGLIDQGQLTHYRSLGPSEHLSTAELAAMIVRAVASLQREANCQPLPALLIGSRHSEGLQHALDKLQLKTRNLSLEHEGATLGRHEQVVAAIALSQLSPASRSLSFDGVLNKRKETTDRWRSLRPAMVLGSLAAVLIVGAVAWSYQVKTQQQQNLDQQLTQLYRASVPEGGRIQDVPKQLRQKLRELQKRSQLIQPDIPEPLTLLSAISRAVPSNLDVKVETFEYTDLETRLEGQCKDLGVLETVKNALSTLPGVQDAQIADAQQQAAGGNVRFRLKLRYKAKDL